MRARAAACALGLALARVAAAQAGLEPQGAASDAVPAPAPAGAAAEPAAAPARPAAAAAAPAPAAAKPSQLKAVVVTAQRREESAQKVPTAVSALSGESLLDAGIGRRSGEVLDYVPNASAATQAHGRPRWWVRGIGAGQQQLDFPNPIGVYLDEVYISNASATGFPLFDVERVEVLRGPQGTLWGKNTTGGAVNIVSRRPTFGPSEQYLRLDYGSFEDKLLEAGTNAVIWKDRLAARTSLHYETSDGRFTNRYDGSRTGGFADAAARLQLLGRISRDAEVTGNVHVRKYTTDGVVATVIGSGAGGAYRNGYVPSTAVGDLSFNAPSNGDVQQLGGNVTLRWQLGPVTLTAISGYEEYRENTLTDSDYTPLEISRGFTDAVSRQWSQELRLASPRTDRLNWVVGAFYFNEQIRSANAAARLTGTSGNYSRTDFEHGSESVAAFGSSTFDLTRDLGVTAGVRWTRESRDLDTRRVGNASGPAFADLTRWWDPAGVGSLAVVYDTTRRNTWNNVTYDVTPAYAITPDARVYARYAFGVKSGGYNTAATTLSAINVVSPEKLTTYEVGAKTSWLDRRVIANAAVFYYDYRDVQVNVVGPLPPTNVAVSYLQNAKKARVQGAELEVEALPIRWVHLSGNVGLLDAKFTDFKVLYGGADYSGNRLVRSPKLSSLLRGDVTLPIGAPFDVILGADWRYQGLQYYYTTDQGNPNLRQSDYSLVNARVTLRSADEKLSLVVYANNVLDEKFKNHTLPGAAGATGNVVYRGDPRTVGAQLIARWW